MRLAFLIVALCALGSSAYADDASAPVYTFTEAQTKIIVDAAIEKRTAAVADYNKWNDLINDISKQAKAQQNPYAHAEPEPEAKK